jgi:hypothetical protein
MELVKVNRFQLMAIVNDESYPGISRMIGRVSRFLI